MEERKGVEPSDPDKEATGLADQHLAPTQDGLSSMRAVRVHGACWLRCESTSLWNGDQGGSRTLTPLGLSQRALPIGIPDLIVRTARAVRLSGDNVWRALHAPSEVSREWCPGRESNPQDLSVNSF